MQYQCLKEDALSKLTTLSRELYDLTNTAPNAGQPYVGVGQCNIWTLVAYVLYVVFILEAHAYQHMGMCRWTYLQYSVSV